jgi:hypothetical protein
MFLFWIELFQKVLSQEKCNDRFMLDKQFFPPLLILGLSSDKFVTPKKS